MGRQKSAPTKLGNHAGCMGLIDFIPKTKRTRRKTKKQPYYNLNTSAAVADEQFYLGELCLGTTNNIIPDSYCKARAAIPPSTSDDNDAPEHLLLEFDGVSVIVAMSMELYLVRDVITSRIFSFYFINRDGTVFMQLGFDTLPLSKFNKKIGLCLKALFTLLYDISCNDVADNDEENIAHPPLEQVYKSIRNCRKVEITPGNIQHAQLKPQLRPYQANAVKWMLHKEKELSLTNVHSDLITIHPLYTPVKLKSGLEVYFDKYTGYLVTTKPVLQQESCGGILADEMGLGKTVEVLACILLNPSPTKRIGSGAANKVYDADACPSVERNSKKRRIRDNETTRVVEGNNKLVDEAKKIKVSSDWVKSGSKKTQTRIALELYYNNCLEELNPYRAITAEVLRVECLCGNASVDTEATVQCVDCAKLQHPSCLGYRKEYGNFRCAQCWMTQPELDSRATLIVSPKALRTQWCNEVRKHVAGRFKILQYDGTCVAPVYPTKLLDYDLVITTYSVLQSELRLSESVGAISLRKQKKYSIPGCPLTRIKWWRLCLDEAQTIDSPTMMVSAMAQKLCAHFRWAVTGTPISKNISDLYGLIEYLHIEPYNDNITWKHLLLNPFLRGDTEPMYKFLAQKMWRSSKAEVIDQINIPKQTIQVHALEFSAVEKYFYKCEHDLTYETFLSKMGIYDSSTPIVKLDKLKLKYLLEPLLSLRQVCTYPNTTRMRYLTTKKPVTSMKDLLEALILKNTNESEECLRLVISALNGLAGIYLLLQNPYEGIANYRKVLQLSARFTDDKTSIKLAVDKLQLIHTMHNLSEILQITPDVEPTLRDDNLQRECGELEQRYIKKFINQTTAAFLDSSAITDTIIKLQNNFILKPAQWYSDLIEWIAIYRFDQELSGKIQTLHDQASVRCPETSDVRALFYNVATWDEEISDLRDQLTDSINGLYQYYPEDEFKIVIDKELVTKATECHLRPDQKRVNGKNNKKCALCITNKQLKNYEAKIFTITKRGVMFEDMALQGSWIPKSEELIFKALLSVAKAKNAAPNIINDGEIHINILETLKKEFKEIRKFWTYLDQQICALDELDMCKIRLRLREPNDPNDLEQQRKNKPNITLRNLTYQLENKLETIHLLSENELDYHRTLLHSDELHNMNRLEKTLGTRSYLETLNKQQFEGESPDPCPICKNSLETHWTILPCGHSYCLECIQVLIDNALRRYIVCSVCRGQHIIGEISYIKVDASDHVQESLVIKGNYSTKIEAVIRLLLELKSENENVKVLVFSTWVSVLKFLNTALEVNNISTQLLDRSRLEKQIEKFKSPHDGVTALLLPINLGSKGLNLIEATHVILIEPLLNPGEEHQAIGRVHRIGQTKPTVVHKFYIKNTVEENIQNAVSSNVDSWDKNNVTIRQLTGLFNNGEDHRAEDASEEDDDVVAVSSET